MARRLEDRRVAGPGNSESEREHPSYQDPTDDHYFRSRSAYHIVTIGEVDCPMYVGEPTAYLNARASGHPKLPMPQPGQYLLTCVIYESCDF